MGVSFVAIDFETANSFRCSPCAIGMVKVVNGAIVDDVSQLVRPPKGFDEFDRFNIRIHGITPKMVEGRERFEEVWTQALGFIDGLPLVAHNAGFDMGVIRESLTVSEIECPELDYACTMVMGRRAYELSSYSLRSVADAAGVSWDEDQHHDARYDALAAAQIALSLANANQSESFEDLLNTLGVSMGKLSAEMWSGCHRSRSLRSKDVEVNPAADVCHPIYGKHVVFTGALRSLTRATAWKMIAELGAVPESRISKMTDILVVGDQGQSTSRRGEHQSSKLRKAVLMRSHGQEIEVMTEGDFLSELAFSEGVRPTDT